MLYENEYIVSLNGIPARDNTIYCIDFFCFHSHEAPDQLISILAQPFAQ